MFNSGVSARDLIDELQNEVDVALPIPNKAYVTWLNALQHMLYTELIREQGKITLLSPPLSPIPISALTVSSGEAPVRYEDIYTVYADRNHLIESTLTSGMIFPDTYYKHGEDLGYNSPGAEKLSIIYFVKPALITVSGADVVGTGDVRVPLEFLDLVKAKLRCEAYKVMNEDGLAAKWVNDYNVLLETFKAWLDNKAPQFGM